VRLLLGCGGRGGRVASRACSSSARTTAALTRCPGQVQRGAANLARQGAGARPPHTAAVTAPTPALRPHLVPLPGLTRGSRSRASGTDGCPPQPGPSGGRRVHAVILPRGSRRREVFGRENPQGTHERSGAYHILKEWTLLSTWLVRARIPNRTRDTPAVLRAQSPALRPHLIPLPGRHGGPGAGLQGGQVASSRLVDGVKRFCTEHFFGERGGRTTCPASPP